MEGAEIEVVYELRYRGQAFELPVPGPPGPDPAQLAEDFAAEHEARYGYRDPEGELELVTIRVSAVEPGPEPRPRAAAGGNLVEGERDARFGGSWVGTRVLRGDPGAGVRAEGPCVFELPEATLVLPPGWTASVDETGTITADARASLVSALDPVALQVMTGALRAACDEMGAVLIRSAHSPNITERHDCSTALFEPAGELVMQAEHIPVHLGSMPDAVAAIVGEDHREGDLWILNDPYRGGTHLPDITLISPISSPPTKGSAPSLGEDLLGFAASRAHHADIGGPTPGGMPALSVTLEEEGVVIPPTRADDAVLTDLARRMRNPEQRLADLRAQRAANLTGIRRMRELAERHGIELLRIATREILDYAERRTRAALAAMRDGESTPGTCSRGATATSLAAAGDRTRGNPRARLRRQRRASRGEPQLPPVGDEGRLLLRRARRLRSGRAALGGGLATGDRQRPARITAQCGAPGGGRRRERRDLEPGRRPRLPGARRVRAGWSGRPGDDEQRDALRPRLDLLRDDRRRTGGMPRR